MKSATDINSYQTVAVPPCEVGHVVELRRSSRKEVQAFLGERGECMALKRRPRGQGWVVTVLFQNSATGAQLLWPEDTLLRIVNAVITR